jgi:hypothetical protein
MSKQLSRLFDLLITKGRKNPQQETKPCGLEDWAGGPMHGDSGDYFLYYDSDAIKLSIRTVMSMHPGNILWSVRSSIRSRTLTLNGRQSGGLIGRSDAAVRSGQKVLLLHIMTTERKEDGERVIVCREHCLLDMMHVLYTTCASFSGRRLLA